ncbi:hypothetical protein [Microtetraspora malaysiensis]|uniref:Uncharacterized protein n=1 Tax=Microtetraspora malaysiensis TaxID=161358 RepID=A0ABW6SKH5_9ACTN
MSEAVVRAEAPVLGLRVGEIARVEWTPYLASVVAGGRLTVVEPAAPDKPGKAGKTSTPDAPADGDDGERDEGGGEAG